jgi:hypothetical protein
MEVEVDADFGDLPGLGGGTAGSPAGSPTGDGGGGGADDSSSDSSSKGSGGDSLAPGLRRAHSHVFVDTTFGAALGLADDVVERLASAAAAGAGTGAPAPGGVLPEVPGGGSPGSSLGGGQVVELVVAYLTSYEHMGRARLSCVRGCACEAREVDAHHSERTSVSAVAVLPLAPAAAGAGAAAAEGQYGSIGGGGMGRCVLRIEVLPETSSGEFKFKAIQVVARAKEVWAGAADDAAVVSSGSSSGGGESSNSSSGGGGSSPGSAPLGNM